MAKYIERDRLLMNLAEECDKYNPKLLNDSHIRHGVSLAANIIKNQPAADVAKVRRGKWIQKEHLVPLARDCESFDYDCYDYTTHSENVKYWHCSHCDYEASRYMKPMYKYCPNCGTKMDGGTEE